jgi:hypothetical protein
LRKAIGRELPVGALREHEENQETIAQGTSEEKRVGTEDGKHNAAQGKPRRAPTS